MAPSVLLHPVQVQQGQSLLVMGPSGVGKTSVLRAIAGLWSSGSGTITRSVTTPPAHLTLMMMCFLAPVPPLQC